MNKMKSKRRMEQILCYVFLILLALMVLVPVLWMISTAFKTEAQTYSPKPQWIPDPISLESFRKFFTTYNFGRMTLNSLVTCIFAMIICITCACLAGYGVTRFQFKGKKQLMNFLLVTQMFPSVMLVVPFYAVLSKYHMTNKLIGLIIVYAATNVAFSTWMLVSYFKTVPIELDEAARVDGAGGLQRIWYIVLPNLKGSLYTIVILSFLNSFKIYREAYLVAGSYPHKSIYLLQHLFNNWFVNLEFDKMAAAAVCTGGFLLVVILLLQRVWDKE